MTFTKPKTRKTNPNHKCEFVRGVQAACSCGWQSDMWFNKGAQANAASQWRAHLEKCEAGSATA